MSSVWLRFPGKDMIGSYQLTTRSDLQVRQLQHELVSRRLCDPFDDDEGLSFSFQGFLLSEGTRVCTLASTKDQPIFITFHPSPAPAQDDSRMYLFPGMPLAPGTHPVWIRLEGVATVLRLFPACTQLVLDLPEVMRRHNVLLPKQDEVITGFEYYGVRLNDSVRLGVLSTTEASPLFVRTELESLSARLSMTAGSGGSREHPIDLRSSDPTPQNLTPPLREEGE